MLPAPVVYPVCASRVGIPETSTVRSAIGEVRATRERLAAEKGYDIRTLYEEAKRRQQETDREIVSELEPTRRLLEVHGSGER